MAIGVDMDQYYTYPEVKSALITSASKNVYNTAYVTVKDFAAGNLKAGVRLSTLANDGLELAPYHEWEDRIPALCKEKVQEARALVIKDRAITGAE